MSIITIILIILGVLIILFATRFLSKTFKIITKILLLLIIILVVLTLLVYKDMVNLRAGFAKSENTFFLYQNEKLYSAVTLKPMTTANLTIDSFTYFTQEEINMSEEYLNKKDYKALLKNNYRILILSPDIINKTYTLKLGRRLNQDDLFSIITSNDPFLILAQKTQQTYNMSVEDLKKGFKDIYGSEEKLKGYLFAGLLTNYFQVQEPGELTRNVKDKKLLIYPETISFKIIKYLPWT